MIPKEINERLCHDVESICRMLLPGGKREGSNWCVGSVNGDEGNSCRIQLVGSKAGLWADFAGNDKGDLLELYSKVKGVSFIDALKWAKDYLGIKDCSQDFVVRKAVPLKKILAPVMNAKALEWFKARKITVEALKAYKINSTGTVVNFPYYKNGDLMFLKYRDVAKPKEQAISAEAGGTQILFGWQAIPDNAREVVICEGEPDALAYASCGIPALSVPLGGGTGNKQDNWIANDYDKLEQFDTIYLSLDMDKAGQEAMATILPRLGNHRCRIVKLPCKDANDTLLAGHDLHEFISASQYCDPEEIKVATSFVSEVYKAFDGDDEILGDKLPWNNKTENKFRARMGEVTIWQGINGHGKSMVLSQIIAGFIINHIRCCVASMEMKPVQQLKRMYQQICGDACPARKDIDYVNDNIMPFMHIVNIRGTAKASRLLELFKYAVLRFGCRHFVIDSLAKCGMAEDDYNSQKLFIEQVGDFAVACNVHVHVVAHARKQEDEKDVPNKMDVKGSGALTDLVDNLIAVWRNKVKEKMVAEAVNIGGQITPQIRAMPDCIMSVQKQRNFDWEGTILLWFLTSCHQYVESSEHGAVPMIKFASTTPEEFD